MKMERHKIRNADAWTAHRFRHNVTQVSRSLNLKIARIQERSFINGAQMKAADAGYW